MEESAGVEGVGVTSTGLAARIEAARHDRAELGHIADELRHVPGADAARLRLRAVMLRRQVKMAERSAAPVPVPVPVPAWLAELGRQAGSPVRLHHYWRDENARAETIEALSACLNFALDFDDLQASHGRKLTIRYNDGSGAVLLFDQGFGYWRATSGDRHDFRAGPNAQARAMLDGATFVSGQGESYVAVTQG